MLDIYDDDGELHYAAMVAYGMIPDEEEDDEWQHQMAA
jgi:hypothetical protein